MNTLYDFFNLMNSLLFSDYGKTSDFWFVWIFFCVGAEMSTVMSISDGLGSYIFRRKMGKAYEERNGWKSVFFPPESAFLPF